MEGVREGEEGGEEEGEGEEDTEWYPPWWWERETGTSRREVEEGWVSTLRPFSAGLPCSFLRPITGLY